MESDSNATSTIDRDSTQRAYVAGLANAGNKIKKEDGTEEIGTKLEHYKISRTIQIVWKWMMQIADGNGSQQRNDITWVGDVLAKAAAEEPNQPVGYLKALKFMESRPEEFVDMARSLFSARTNRREIRNGRLYFETFLDKAADLYEKDELGKDEFSTVFDLLINMHVTPEKDADAKETPQSRPLLMLSKEELGDDGGLAKPAHKLVEILNKIRNLTKDGTDIHDLKSDLCMRIAQLPRFSVRRKEDDPIIPNNDFFIKFIGQKVENGDVVLKRLFDMFFVATEDKKKANAGLQAIGVQVATTSDDDDKSIKAYEVIMDHLDQIVQIPAVRHYLLQKIQKLKDPTHREKIEEKILWEEFKTEIQGSTEDEKKQNLEKPGALEKPVPKSTASESEKDDAYEELKALWRLRDELDKAQTEHDDHEKKVKEMRDGITNMMSELKNTFKKDLTDQVNKAYKNEGTTPAEFDVLIRNADLAAEYCKGKAIDDDDLRQAAKLARVKHVHKLVTEKKCEMNVFKKLFYDAEVKKAAEQVQEAEEKKETVEKVTTAWEDLSKAVKKLEEIQKKFVEQAEAKRAKEAEKAQQAAAGSKGPDKQEAAAGSKGPDKQEAAAGSTDPPAKEESQADSDKDKAAGTDEQHEDEDEEESDGSGNK